MARIRTVKPEFWSSPDTAVCEDPWARLLYIAMWNWADDHGRGTANAKELAGFAFPNDEKIDSADIRRMLGGILRAFGVVFYEVGGRPYYAIPSWDRHQKIDKRSGGKYPGPEEGNPWSPDPKGASDRRKHDPPGVPAESPEESVESAPTPRRTLDAGTGEQGNRGTGEKLFLSETAEPPADEESDAEPQREDVEALCSRLAEWMITNGAKPPTVTKQWRREARLLLDRDKRELSKALNLIDWCQQDPFWLTNIHSISKFRKQYDQLTMKAREDWRRNAARPKTTRDAYGNVYSTSSNAWA